jgi:peptidyl-tRNA hydrolase ICT1
MHLPAGNLPRLVHAVNLSVGNTCRLIHANRPNNASVYKSQYNIENLYPNAFAASRAQSSKIVTSDENVFTGYIPLEDLQITYSRSSGPGGQNVNKVSSKVEIRFHVETSKWIPNALKPKLLHSEASRITKNGYLVVKSEKTRSQMLNQADCLDRIRTMVRQCDVKPHVPTQDELDLIQRRQNKARAAMLREKKDHSLKKQSRLGPSSRDI